MPYSYVLHSPYQDSLVPKLPTISPRSCLGCANCASLGVEAGRLGRFGGRWDDLDEKVWRGVRHGRMFDTPFPCAESGSRSTSGTVVLVVPSCAVIEQPIRFSNPTDRALLTPLRVFSHCRCVLGCQGCPRCRPSPPSFASCPHTFSAFCWRTASVLKVFLG